MHYCCSPASIPYTAAYVPMTRPATVVHASRPAPYVCMYHISIYTYIYIYIFIYVCIIYLNASYTSSSCGNARLQQLKASYTSSLRPHTLVARVATLVFNSLRPHTQLKASGTSTYNIYVQKYTTKYSSLYISIGCLHLSAYCTEVQQSCNRAATELQQYQHIGCLHLSAYGAGERSPEALSY